MGIERMLKLLSAFQFGPEELDCLGVDKTTREQLGAIEIDTGEVWAVADGTIVLAQETLFEVTVPLPIAQLLETPVMNLVPYSTTGTIESAAAALRSAGATGPIVVAATHSPLVGPAIDWPRGCHRRDRPPAVRRPSARRARCAHH